MVEFYREPFQKQIRTKANPQVATGPCPSQTHRLRGGRPGSLGVPGVPKGGQAIPRPQVPGASFPRKLALVSDDGKLKGKQKHTVGRDQFELRPMGGYQI